MPRENDLMDQLRKLYAEVDAMTLATVDEHGRPHAATVYFAADDELNLYYLSDPSALHCRHAEVRPTVAAAMQTRPRMWQQIRGVQLHATAEPITDEAARAHAWEWYGRKFPHIHEVENLARDQRFYRLIPTWVRCIDYSMHYGNQLESPRPPTQEPVRGEGQ